jgi:hypothetical protein
MPRVHSAELAIEYNHVGVGDAYVTVRSTLEFSQEDLDREFRFRISLFGSDVGEESTPSAWPLYQFRFLKVDKGGGLPRTYDVVHGAPGTVRREDHATLKISVLDEDPGYKWIPVELPPWTPPGAAKVLFPDEIYATVSLAVEESSPVFIMTYVPRLYQ